jgi:N-acetylglucosamine-6-sulfatase
MDRPIVRARRLMVVPALIALAALVAALATHRAEGATPKNVIFILTDDQTASELSAMPNTQALLVNQGVTFRRAYASYPLCCPSRATLLTGQFMHNHGVRGNLGLFGGWGRFFPHEANALPVRTRASGYYNVHIGKYMNGYSTTGVPPLPVPAGWDEWYAKISEDSLYFNYSLVEKSGPGNPASIAFYGGESSDYQTDAFRDKAIDFLEHLGTNQQPFMLNVWFNAPHGPFEPAPRHLFAQSTLSLPALPGFNEKDISDKPRWLRKQARRRLSRNAKGLIASERRRRMEQLLSVDEAVGRIVNYLAGRGLLNDTYIVFTSDNGFFRGEHRIAGGKYLPHEPSSRVPLVIRGPGIPPGTSDELVSLTDVPQTILDIAGRADPALDGRSLLPYARNPALRSRRPVLLEGDTGPGGGGAGDPAISASARASVARAGLAGKRGVSNLDQEKNPIASLALSNGNSAPAYKAIRTDRYLYVLYANGQTELYDMKRDPAQLRSLATDPRYKPVRKFLRTNLVPLSSCVGTSCRVEIGTEPAPLKRQPKPKRKGKGKEKREQPGARPGA